MPASRASVITLDYNSGLMGGGGGGGDGGGWGAGGLLLEWRKQVEEMSYGKILVTARAVVVTFTDILATMD